jgi:hypothetical protein
MSSVLPTKFRIALITIPLACIVWIQRFLDHDEEEKKMMMKKKKFGMTVLHSVL